MFHNGFRVDKIGYDKFWFRGYVETRPRFPENIKSIFEIISYDTFKEGVPDMKLTEGYFNKRVKYNVDLQDFVDIFIKTDPYKGKRYKNP
jgi:hypothetical protein